MSDSPAAPPEGERKQTRVEYFTHRRDETRRPDQWITLVYDTVLDSVSALNTFRRSLMRHGPLVDSIVIVMKNDPAADMPRHPDWRSRGQLPAPEQAMLSAFTKGITTEKAHSFIAAWAKGIVGQLPGSRVGMGNVTLAPASEDPAFNAAKAAEHTAPDWILAIRNHDLLDDRITRAHLDRLMMNPDPQVTAYDFGLAIHWIDAQHYRSDGNYPNRHGVALWRAQPLVPGIERGRMTNIRLRHFGLVRTIDQLREAQRTRDGSLVKATGVQIDVYTPDNGIGFHGLVYGGEDPERVASMLDLWYPLVDHMVLAWTDPAPPESPADQGGMSDELRAVVEVFGCDVIHVPLRADGEVNFAACRNVTMDALMQWNEQRNARLGWGVFADPDEQPMDAEWGRHLRRMADAAESYGWLFTFNNPMPDGSTGMSESMRLHKLVPQLRFKGRIHETFDRSIKAITDAGDHPALGRAPFNTFNPGLSEPGQINDKLLKYARGLAAELDDDPHNDAAWVSLGLMYEAEGDVPGNIEKAVRCWDIAATLNNTGYLAPRLLMMHYLRLARGFAHHTLERTSTGHPYIKQIRPLVEMLDRVAPMPSNPATERIMEHIVFPAPPHVTVTIDVDRAKLEVVTGEE